METSDETVASSVKPTSRKGRYWLRASRESAMTSTSESTREFAQSRADAAHELPFQTRKKPALPFHESVVVSIPDVAQSAPQEEQQQPPSMASVVAAIGASALIGTAEATDKIDTSDLPVAPPEPATAPPSFTLPTPLTTKSIDDAVAASRALQDDREKSEIRKIADQIMEQFPLASPATILFVGSEDSIHIDECCARVAAELAARSIGRILLVDSDFEKKRLTVASGMSENAGLSEIMNVALNWRDAVLTSGSSKLDFIPAGTYSNRRWNPDELLRDALAEMRARYQMICVSGGDAHGAAAKSWSRFCDGSYLVVSIRNSNDRVAESAAIRLRQLGARLIGCIVTDAAP